jgi:hypothetical protein
VRIACQPCTLHKSGNAPEEYEDAYAPCDAFDQDLGPDPLRVAVADGATDSSFSGRWAGLLAEAYAGGHLFDSDHQVQPDQLDSLQHEWRTSINRTGLPWYAEAKLALGAYATLLGITFDLDTPTSTGCRWRAAAIGDSTLFQVRDGQLLTAFPIVTAADFTNHPVLVSSVARANQHLASHTDSASGTCVPGDTLYLMTDALAHWVLNAAEQGEFPWDTLDRVTADGTFSAWVAQLRQDHALRNDDVTLLRLSVAD